MLKQITTGLTLMISVAAFSQVGIQTETPQATLDVAGAPADATKLDGIIAPRIEGAQLRAKTYTTTQTGALVYVTLADTAPAGQTIDVTAPGYYYFNGTKWVKSGASDMVNIYNANGTLTSTRTLNQDGKTLTFSNAQRTTFYNDAGTGLVQSSGTGTRASIALATAGGNQFELYTDNNSVTQLLNTGRSEGLILGSSYTTNPGFVSFVTTPTSGAAGVERMRINSIGNVGIDTQNLSTEKFDVNGISRLRNLPLNGATNAIFTTSGGTASATQNQTFTATRTLVADANGVVGYVTGLPNNIYNANGSLTNNRTLTLNGNYLRFQGSDLFVNFPLNGAMSIENTKTSGAAYMALFGGNNTNLSFYQYYNSDAAISATGNTTGLQLMTHATTQSAPITFLTSAGSNALATEKMRITGTGNVGIGTGSPTERFHNSGNVRLQGLPLNGATNAIFTTSGGGASTTQNQTFTATRTLVSDANGVVGYVAGTPIFDNIYTANGSLTSNRTLTLNSRTMEFIGSANKTSWNTAGSMTIEGLNTTSSGRPRLTLTAPDGNANGTTTNMFMLVNSEGSAGIFADGDVTSLNLVVSPSGIAGVERPINFQTSIGSISQTRMTLTGAGRLGVQEAVPQATLHIRRTSSDLTPAIIDGCNMYADNAAAVAAGLPVGGLYRKADGTLMVRY